MNNLKLSISINNVDQHIQYTFRIFDTKTMTNFHSFDCVYFEQGYDYEKMIENIKNSQYKEVLNDFQF